MSLNVDNYYWRYIKLGAIPYIATLYYFLNADTSTDPGPIIGFFLFAFAAVFFVFPFLIYSDKQELSKYSNNISDRSLTGLYFIFYFLFGFLWYPALYMIARVLKIKNIDDNYEDVLDDIEKLSGSIENVEASIHDQDFQAGLEASKRRLSKIAHIRSAWSGIEHENFSLNDLQSSYYSLAVMCAFELSKSLLDEAKSAAESDKLRKAVTISEEAKSMAFTLKEHNRDLGISPPNSVDNECLEDLSKLQVKAHQMRSEWYREWLVDRVNAANEVTENIPAALDELDEIFQELSATDIISNRENDVIWEAAEDAYLTLTIREGERRVSEGKQQFREGAYLESANSYVEGRKMVEEAIESDAGISENTTLQDLRSELMENYWETLAARGMHLLKLGREQYEQEEFEEARNTFGRILEQIDDANGSSTDGKRNPSLSDIRSIAAYNMDTASQAALGIRNETQILRTIDGEETKQNKPNRDVTERTGSDRDLITSDVGQGPPNAIPGLERQSVSYNEITQNGRIGRGGDADVYDATIQSNGESIQVALKQPREQGTIHSGQVGRFTTEAETWSKLDEHDYIVGVVDWGDTPLPWILLEKMDGGNLATSMDDFSFEQSIWTAQCVSEAVAHAHSRGIAHLDLKPANILFRTTGTDSWPVPKVGDWGLSRPMLDEERDSGGLTPEYAAPEQIDSSRFGAPDQSTDIYQLGAVFYHLLTNRTPHVGDDASQLAKIVDDPVVPPSEVNTSLPPAVDEVLLKGLARHKEDRYESVLYFRDRLTALADRDPVDQ